MGLGALDGVLVLDDEFARDEVIGRASSTAIAVVRGTDNARATPPTEDLTISIDTASPVSTSWIDRSATLKSSSSGNAPPA